MSESSPNQDGEFTPLTNRVLDSLAHDAEAIAREAGAILRGRFGQPHVVRYKGPLDLVTEADQASEALIVDRLRAAYPAHDLLAEEGSATIMGSDFRWVVDPLDGTTNFAHGLPTFAVSIGLEHQGRPIVGVVFDPMRNEMFVAARGRGARLNGVVIAVAPTERLIGAVLVTGFSYDLEQRARQAVAWRDVLLRVQAVRQTGSAALNLCYVASGRMDGYWERGISPWDVAAGAVLVTEAGGTVTGFGGSPFHLDDRHIVATNGLLHDDLLAILPGASQDGFR